MTSPEQEPLTARWVARDVATTQRLAERLGALLRAGDLVLLTGGLGAGKTTFTQGLALGLRVRGPITSPTFVVSREHPSLVGGPPLVHVDAYRLQGAAELDDLDLDAELAEAVTVVEWGHGLAEALSEDYLELTLDRAGDGSGGSGDGPGVRVARVRSRVRSRATCPGSSSRVGTVRAGRPCGRRSPRWRSLAPCCSLSTPPRQPSRSPSAPTVARWPSAARSTCGGTPRRSPPRCVTCWPTPGCGPPT
ncbi:hypothetical protein GCM10025872_28230 [Barrientosiimonas endolithica]|uniref:tRNA threonylcarbamoyladenosine biosynthesis protein TsaE n=1 Tax=Barrientosiimonas endolithica TaxID=1535208 RepID=A0ABN6YPR8_9MICO|nr:hypothetical protein GCM10025872_28230 [Barrientosiimonas endolithica]